MKIIEYSTSDENGKCPNIACCQEKGIEGCYVCDEVENCKKGFYADGNDGANACKAQALFVKKYGIEAFLAVQDKLHLKYEFKKIQEILDDDVAKALKYLTDVSAE